MKKDIERSLRIFSWILLDLLLLIAFALFLGAGVPYVLKLVYKTDDPLLIASKITGWFVPVLVLLVGIWVVFFMYRRIMRGR